MPPRFALRALPFALAAASVSCTDGGTMQDAGPDSDLVRSYTEPRCSTPGLVPFRDGSGGTACDRVGSGAEMASAMFPPVDDLTAPFAYVQTGAPATGADGTMAHPYPDIATALTMMPTATAIVVSSGTYMIPATITVATMMPLEIRGAGSATGGTVLLPTTRTPVFSASGAMTELTVTGMAIRFNGVTNADTQAIGVQSTMSANLILRDVSIDDAYDGAVALGATLDLGSVTITGSLHRGVSIANGTDGTRSLSSVADSLIRGSFGQGFVSDGGTISIVHSGIVSNLRGGLVMRGGDPMQPSSVDTVTVQGNSIVGLSVSGADAGLIVSELLASGTQSSSDGQGGDGMYIGPGANVMADLMIMEGDVQATGSEFVANARTGILVSGDATMPPPMGGNLQISAPLVASNRGGGLIVQSGASVPMIALGVFAENTGVGIATTTQGKLETIRGCQFLNTRNGVVSTGAGDIMAGDGISLGDSPMETVAITDDEFTGNDRFAAVFTSGTVMLSATRGTGNAYGIGNYGAMLSMSGTNTVMGMMAAPQSAPMVVRGAMIPPP